ncbi:MAG: amidohydrolase family protein [Betaproteobacteria bacterium]|nr:amidohydrolase family protein [Betaproteobacteria bacterium]
MIVDLEHHLEPRAVWEKRGGKPGQLVVQHAPDGTPLRPLDDATHDIAIHLKNMDIGGIDMAVLSGTEVDSVEEARLFNDHFAKIVREHPARFDALATTLPLGGKPALDELERAVRVLGLKGVLINAVVQGEPVDSRRLWPFYEKVCELNVPVFVHPSIKLKGFDACAAPYDLVRTIGREFDMALATIRLCAGGVLAEFPDLKVIVAHFGGGFSSIKERMDRYIGFLGEKFWQGKPLISAPYLDNYNRYFERLYFNMAGREAGIQTIRCALTNISPARLLFATDYPSNFIDDGKGMRAYVEKIRQLDLDRSSIDGMLGGNAIDLLGLNL